MPGSFNFNNPPFDTLSESERQLVINNLDLSYHADGDIIVQAQQPTKGLHIIHKGVVEERNGTDHEDIYAHYTHDDMFDIRSLFSGTSKHEYVCLEETICYQLPRTTFDQLSSQNTRFRRYFQTDLVDKQQLMKQEGQQNLSEFILNKIEPDNILPLQIVDADATIAEVTLQMKQTHTDCALIKSDRGYGMLTGTDLLHASVLERMSVDTPVASLAHYELISVQTGDFLFDAMLLMTRHKIERVVVYDSLTPDKVLGVLTLTHILSLLSTHSHILALRIARANDAADLKRAVESLDELIERLMTNGIKSRFISKLLSTLHEQVVSKVFDRHVPTEVQQHCCLVFMGSAGRNEQILKGPLDYGLIIEDNYAWEACQPTMQAMHAELVSLGYTPSKGEVCVGNPMWAKPLKQWLDQSNRWILDPSSENIQKIATVFDVHGVAGKLGLSHDFQQRQLRQISSDHLFVRNFTRPALQFHTPLTFFGQLKLSWHSLDLNRGGVFPIVQGVRALAMEQRLPLSNTFERIDELAHNGVLDKGLAGNLAEALQLFLQLQLEQQRSGDQQPDAQLLDLGTHSRSQRDLLRHALHVVKKFKQYLEVHFHLENP
ncbi:putative nucleotidyltransferase substrate binding domain-containing protein [Aestuariirhabdus litorea]|uniref:Cyclic nucleotide-binding/CBS domain-containing protein n=1 Tax=Aestuariirhabdus litorea TaxID=2528527 RepID=A0A3P3VML9_9GAMM|nr:putative nucleotidyltransferase substrate binding domain-containing protein [Aestuariirhabdus litorea]RRJ84011.1 cyclic nucleotide-binding/CBS domain-containing protein [Aestuariirhabdus litorea]RWW97231.1 cyclic nucleotide-binding domain-containing protein [Endozoicomonadaceae bacterium GTF-13]